MLSKVKIETTSRPPLDDLETAIIDIFTRATKILGYPKSIGEIYGLLYISAKPLCMEDIIRRLGISLGAASQGLKVLKSIRAVKSNHMIGKRREYFTAELELENLLRRYFRKEFSNYLNNWKSQQTELRMLFNANGTQESHAHLNPRIENLEQLHTRTNTLLKKVCEHFGAET